MKAYCNKTNHIRIYLNESEAFDLATLLSDYQEMLASFNAEELGHGDLGILAEKVLSEMRMAKAKQNARNQIDADNKKLRERLKKNF